MISKIFILFKTFSVYAFVFSKVPPYQANAGSPNVLVLPFA
jgi:hypothetical protein